MREHSTRLGQHKIDSIDEIVGDVTPADFPARLTSARWNDAELASASRRRSMLRRSASSAGTSCERLAVEERRVVLRPAALGLLGRADELFDGAVVVAGVAPVAGERADRLA